MDTRNFRIQRTHGLITRPAARAAGFDDRDIARLVGTGTWIAVRRGVYAEAELWLRHDGDAHAQRDHERRLQTRAVDLRLRGDAYAFSHDSAALEHGLPLLTGAGELVHVTRARSGDTHREYGIAHHTADFASLEVARRGGLPVLPLARTALDLTREHGYVAGMIATDAALRLGASLEELRTIRSGMTSWPGITQVDGVLADADAGAESPGESLLRIAVRRLGLGTVRTQFPLKLSDGRVVWLDVLVGCHDFEFDGRIKLKAAANGGVATTSPEEVAWEEKKRERLIRAEGIGVSRTIWEDVSRTDGAADRRLRDEFARSSERFGTRLPAHLEEFATRMEPIRQRRLRARRAVEPLD